MARRDIVIETKLTADELRAGARSVDSRRAAMRMLAIANELAKRPWGYDREEAARLAGMSDQALRDAIKRFNAEGIDGLFDKPRAGRPVLLDEAQDAEIKAAVLKGPDIEADGRSRFTLDDVRQLIVEKFSVAYHIKSMSRVMRRLEMTRQKPRPDSTLVHPKKDPAAEAVFKKRPTQCTQNC
jgi:transposase